MPGVGRRALLRAHREPGPAPFRTAHKDCHPFWGRLSVRRMRNTNLLITAATRNGHSPSNFFQSRFSASLRSKEPLVANSHHRSNLPAFGSSTGEIGPHELRSRRSYDRAPARLRRRAPYTNGHTIL